MSSISSLRQSREIIKILNFKDNAKESTKTVKGIINGLKKSKNADIKAAVSTDEFKKINSSDAYELGLKAINRALIILGEKAGAELSDIYARPGFVAPEYKVIVGDNELKNPIATSRNDDGELKYVEGNKINQADKLIKGELKNLKKDGYTLDKDTEFYDKYKVITDVNGVKKLAPIMRREINIKGADLSSHAIKFYNRFDIEFEGYIANEREMYISIKEAQKQVIKTLKGKEPQHIILYFDSGENKVRRITFSAADLLRSFESFRTQINKYRIGAITTGSDVLADHEELILDHIAFIRVGSITAGHGQMLFKTYDKAKNGRQYKNGECAYIALLNCDHEYIGAPSDLKDLEFLYKYIQENKLPIALFTNSAEIDFNKVSQDGSIIEENFIWNPEDRLIGYNNDTLAKKINSADYTCDNKTIYLKSILEPPDYKYIIIVCDEYKHAEACSEIKYREFTDKAGVHIKRFEPVFRDDLYIDCVGNVINHKVEKVLKSTQNIANSRPSCKLPVNTEYLVFDYETNINFKNKLCMQEYSLSQLHLTESEMQKLSQIDKDEDYFELFKYIKYNSKTHVGFDSSYKFIDYILEHQNNVAFKLISYNGANFDNLILLNACLNYKEHNQFKEFSVDGEFFNGNSLLNFKINKVHDMFDINKHIMGSLKDNCKSFKIKCAAKKAFDFTEAQKLYDTGKLADEMKTLQINEKFYNARYNARVKWIRDKTAAYESLEEEQIKIQDKLYKENVDMFITQQLFEKGEIEFKNISYELQIAIMAFDACAIMKKMKIEEWDKNNPEPPFTSGDLDDCLNSYIIASPFIKNLVIYNTFDVLSTAVLYQRYREALMEYDLTKEISAELHNHKTIGGITWKIFEKETAHLKFPKLTYKQYKDLLTYKIAGRVECFHGAVKIEEAMTSLDVCSLYPYVMAVLDCYYPLGDTVETDKYIKNKIGFYYCDIDQSNLKAANLPLIYAHKKLNAHGDNEKNEWDYEGILENYLISNVTIEVLRKYGCKVTIKCGFYFTDKIKSCELFKFILEFMKGKNAQDKLKASESELYNAALRETLKLLMNAPSGKVIEGLHCEKVIGIQTAGEYLKYKTMSEDNKISDLNFVQMIGDTMFISYKENEEKQFERGYRPVYLGCLIYDYARRHMYDYSYSAFGLDKIYYTDTDATKAKLTDKAAWHANIIKNNLIVPHWPEVEEYDERYKTHLIYDPSSKVFGSYEDELDELNNSPTAKKFTFYCLQKKTWLYSNGGNSKNDKVKFKFKGVNRNSVVIYGDEEFIDCEMERKAGHIEKEEVYLIKPDLIYTAYKHFNDESNKLEYANNALNFFDKMFKMNEGYVLCQSFRRIVKNSLHNVKMNEKDRHSKLMNSVQVSYVIKKIRV